MPTFNIVVFAAIAGLLVGAMFVLGAPYLALPIAAVAIGVIGAITYRQRVKRATDEPARMREEAGEERPVQFTERDRETLLPSAGDESRGDREG